MKKIGSERDGGFDISQAKWQMMKIPVSSKREKRERNRSKSHLLFDESPTQFFSF
jgi:hypothetical protein